MPMAVLLDIDERAFGLIITVGASATGCFVR